MDTLRDIVNSMVFIHEVYTQNKLEHIAERLNKNKVKWVGRNELLKHKINLKVKSKLLQKVIIIWAEQPRSKHDNS